ncbi:sulfurtransferase complex subunit TusC [Mangrovimicrobium sediminis]|uniref:sulfurtransferase complex subunit TusC n=1 Tax=Mangrovimicrobium sediminis TaxID=2562682 RepID=UPI001436B902|nr:sulfurtransferase complex subunit TusC [Haliea sp. SAOS-164]
MGTSTRKRQLLVLRHAPYHGAAARAAVDLALAMAAFEQDVELLFLGDGVLQLLKDQAADALGRKSLGRILSSLPLYDIERVYVDAAALARFAIAADALVLPVEPLAEAEIHALMNACDQLVSC